MFVLSGNEDQLQPFVSKLVHEARVLLYVAQRMSWFRAHLNQTRISFTGCFVRVGFRSLSICAYLFINFEERKRV